MDIEQLRASIARIQEETSLMLRALSEPLPSRILVRAGDNLQEILRRTGAKEVELEPGVTFEGSYTVNSNTIILGAQSAIHSSSMAPAIRVPVGVHDVNITLREANTAWDQCIVEVGEYSDRQTRIEDAPFNIVLNVNVPTYRGKRAFALHSRNTSLIDCEVLDVHDPGGRDSQAIWIGNAPGDINIIGGTFEAGSENILIGGIVTPIPGLIQGGITIENITLKKPLSWRTDGIARSVKNLFELKSGRNITVRNVKMDGCWRDGQAGYAIVLTPRQGKTIENVLFEDIEIRNTSSVMNLLGYDDSGISGQTKNITFRRVNSVVSRAMYSGDGRFLLSQSEPANLTIEDCIHVGDGSSTIYTGRGYVVLPDGTRRPGGPFLGFRMVHNTMTFSQYGMYTSGLPYAQRWREYFTDGVIERNIFRNADPRTQANLPGNEFI